MTAHVYARMELNKHATDLRQDSDIKLRPEQKRYKKNYDRYVCFAPIFQTGDYTFLDRPPLFCSAAGLSASEAYNILLRRNMGAYKVFVVNATTLNNHHEGLQNTICIHWSNATRSSMRDCNYDQTKKALQRRRSLFGQGNRRSMKQR